MATLSTPAARWTTAIVVLLVVVDVNSSSPYDDLCDGIVDHARRASRLHNVGDEDASRREREAARADFEEAVRLDSSRPQAYLNMANFLYNTQQLNESLVYWEIAREKLPPDVDPDVVAYVERRSKRTLFGVYSIARDRVYDSGQGNLTGAMHWIEKQLEVYEEHPEILFDAGIVSVMRNASDRVVAQYLTASHNAAMKGWLAEKRSSGYRCDERKSSIVYNWRHAASGVRIEGDAQSQQYVAVFKNVVLYGQDGLLSRTHKKSGTCKLYLPSAGIYHNLPLNLPLRAGWLMPPEAPENVWPPHDYTKGRVPNSARRVGATAPTLPLAASIVGYMTTSYYHFVTESLGRLLVLLPYLRSYPNMRLIIPATSRRPNSFAVQYLRLLLPTFFDDDINSSRLIWYDAASMAPIDVRVRVKQLYYANWDTVRLRTSIQEEENDEDEHVRTITSHCLVPGHLLREIRTSLLAAAGFDKISQHTRNRVVLCLRSTETMRKLHIRESRSFVEALRVNVDTFDTYELHIFEGGLSVTSQIELFSHAAVVIGIHGGALTNIVFCASGTLVVEIGFETLQSNHYEHVAQSLGLIYAHHNVDDNGLSLGAEFVSIRNQKAVVATVANFLRKHDQGRDKEL